MNSQNEDDGKEGRVSGLGKPSLFQRPLVVRGALANEDVYYICLSPFTCVLTRASLHTSSIVL